MREPNKLNTKLFRLDVEFDAADVLSLAVFSDCFFVDLIEIRGSPLIAQELELLK